MTAYDAAGTIVDMLDAQSDVLHLVHSKPSSWSSIIEAFSKELQLPAVPFAEWLDSLEDAYAAMQSNSSDAGAVERSFRENPALRLMDFFRAAKKHLGSPFVEPLGIPKLEDRKSTRLNSSH